MSAQFVRSSLLIEKGKRICSISKNGIWVQKGVDLSAVAFCFGNEGEKGSMKSEARSVLPSNAIAAVAGLNRRCRSR